LLTPSDLQQLVDVQTRIAAHKVEDAVMHAAEAFFLQDLVRHCSERAIGKEEQLDGLLQTRVL